MVVAERVSLSNASDSIANKFTLGHGADCDVRGLEAQFEYFKSIGRTEAMWGVVTEIATYVPLTFGGYMAVARFYGLPAKK